MQRVRIQCAKFWSPTVTAADVFHGMPFLFDHFEFIEASDADFVLFSMFPGEMPDTKATRVFYTGENVRPDFNTCDWAFSFDYDEELRHPRHLRLPNYVRLGAGIDLVKTGAMSAADLRQKTRFCNFIYHRETPERTRFFERLSKYKPIDAPGLSCNNLAPVGGHATPGASRFARGFHGQKVEFQRPYKFTIAFENEVYPGYTTEKLYHAMLANTLPIYWGNPLVHRDFNPRSFLNAADFASLEDLVEAVVELDRNDDLYLQYMSEPWYNGNVVSRYADQAVILDRFTEIFAR